MVPTRTNTPSSGTIQVKLGFAPTPNSHNLMEYDEIYGELVKRSRPSLVSAPPVSIFLIVVLSLFLGFLFLPSMYPGCSFVLVLRHLLKTDLLTPLFDRLRALVPSAHTRMHTTTTTEVSPLTKKTKSLTPKASTQTPHPRRLTRHLLRPSRSSTSSSLLPPKSTSCL